MSSSSASTANMDTNTPPESQLNAMAKPFTPTTKPKRSNLKSLGKAKVRARRPSDQPHEQQFISREEPYPELETGYRSSSPTTFDNGISRKQKNLNRSGGHPRNFRRKDFFEEPQSAITVRTIPRGAQKQSGRASNRASDRDENWRSRPYELQQPLSATPAFKSKNHSDKGKSRSRSDDFPQESASAKQTEVDSVNSVQQKADVQNKLSSNLGNNPRQPSNFPRPKYNRHPPKDKNLNWQGSPRERKDLPVSKESAYKTREKQVQANRPRSAPAYPITSQNPTQQRSLNPRTQHQVPLAPSAQQTKTLLKPNIERQVSDESLIPSESEQRSQGKEQSSGSQHMVHHNINVYRSTSVISAEESDERSQREKLEKQLQKGTHACLVCMANIRPEQSIWSCHQCYNVFHLRCIQDWARSKQDIWCCPTCQCVNKSVPKTYLCYCGKQTNPEYNRNETAHSCGDMCGKTRPHGCTHPCNELCHPGRCSSCGQYKYSYCLCSKSCQRVQCGVADPVRCSQICTKMLSCGKHQCEEMCHSPPCKPCEEMREEDCYCGAEKRTIPCTDRPDGYSCDRICDKLMDCGNHSCKLICHDGPCECALTPERLLYCHCGKTEISELVRDGKAEERKSCLDEIPTCEKKCGRILECGPTGSRHRCEKLCHEGPCKCELTSDVKCRCGNKTVNMRCEELEQYKDSPYECKKKCKIMKSCGRHKCNQNCCVLPDHTCLQICNKKLSCKQHQCQELCHHGNCPPCSNTSFDELHCHCGAEVIYPPIHCGTAPPECKRSCTRDHPCDHQAPHPCHSNDTCPPCPVLVDRWCMGKHELRSSIMCFMKDVSCGKECFKMLPCGQHRCKQTCHKDACPTVCNQPCTRARPNCGHDCGAQCHPDTPCPNTPCKSKITVTCKCGRKSEQAVCSEFNKVKGGAVQMFLGNQVDVEPESRSVTDYQCLSCDEECRRVIRNKELADALDIVNEEIFKELSSPVSTGYNDILVNAARKDAEFVATVEKVFIDLIEQLKTGTQKTRRYPFPPMKRDKRQIIHELGEVYQINTESFDDEPKRSVVATAERGRSRLPNQTLTSYVKTKSSSGSGRPPVPVPVHLNSNLQQLRERKLITQKEELKAVGKVDYFDFTD